MEITLIEYPKCTTCQKGKKFLEKNNVKFQDRNIITETPTYKELEKWIKNSGKETRKWFNTSGLKYRELNLKEKLGEMSNEEMIKLLASDGMLIKRPILITDKKICNGFKENEWNEAIK